MYRLFHEFAHRYDLHTPPGHYQHDHAFVISEALRTAPAGCCLLDIGCGTGVFLEAAIAAGIDGYGIDSAPEMIEIARRRVGTDRVSVQRMQDLSHRDTFDVISAISWVINYSNSAAELDDVLHRCHLALRSRGTLLLQVANDQKMTGAVDIERELRVSDDTDATIFIHRFSPILDEAHCVTAQYVYANREFRELLCEQHELRFADPLTIAERMTNCGFDHVDVINPASISPFVVGKIE